MIFHNMLLQDEGVNKNEDIEKSVIISSKTGAEVYKFIIRFVYAGRELNYWDWWAIFTGVFNLLSY